MSDIVERLRDHKNYSPLHHEAADEIERLKAALQQAKLQRIVDVEATLVRKEAEIARLKAALREIADSDVHWRAVNVARVALARAALEGKP